MGLVGGCGGVGGDVVWLVDCVVGGCGDGVCGCFGVVGGCGVGDGDCVVGVGDCVGGEFWCFEYCV